MNLQDIMNEITALGGRIRTAAMALASRAQDPSVSIQDIERENSALGEMKTRMKALQDTYQTMLNAQTGSMQLQGIGTGSDQPAQSRSLQDMLKSNEYARAFAFAIRNGVNRRNGGGVEECKVLFDALTEGGGTPVGTDGGFLVPEDMDFTIREKRRALNPLADVFANETTSAMSGWRLVDKAPTAGMTEVDEMDTIPQDDQPAFARITYALKKYGLIIPASNELLTDNVSNLFGYLGKWFAKKMVLTENLLLLTKLKTLTATDMTSAGIKGLKKVFNMVLDPDISASATIVTNQNGFGWLDALEDLNGRPLLQPDPTNATLYRCLGHNVKVMSNATMPNTVTGSGETAKTTADFYIGDGQEFATLFTRQGLEIASTDIGGNAFRTDSTEVRGIARIGVNTFDTEAMVRRSISVT